MPTLEKLTQADLNKVVNTKSLRKARGYVDRVQQAVRSGSTLTARVSGSQLYEVDIEVGPDGIHGRCSCPAAWGGFCKHIGAVLLKWIEAPRAFSVKEPAPKPAGFPLPVTPVEPPPTSRPKNQPFWLASSAATRRQAGHQQLANWLEAITLQDLRTLAKKRGWQVKGNKKAEIIQQIIEQMTNPVDILKASRSLDAEHQQVFRAMLVLGDEPGIKAEDLERVAAGWGKLTSYKQITTYTSHLCQSGLAISGGVAPSYPPRIDFVPQAIARQLPSVLTEVIPAVTDLSSNQPASELSLADPVALVRTAHQLILLLEQSSTPLRPPMPRPQIEKFYQGLADWDYDPGEVLSAKERGKLQGYSDITLAVPPPAWSLPDEAIERLAPIAGGEARLEFIFSLLVAAGLFQPGSPVTVWPEVKEQFLRYNEPMQRALLSRVYFHMRNWSELWEVLRAEDQLQLRRSWIFSTIKPESLWTDLVRFRQLALRVLVCLPDDQWIKLDDLYPLMKRVWPRFDHSVWQFTYYYGPTGQRAGWFLARRSTEKALSSTDEDWQLAQWNFIRRLITGPLYWLGLVDLLFKDGAPLEMRLHGLGDLYWDRVEAPAGSDYPITEAAAPPPAEAVTINEYTIQVNPAAISAQAHSLFDKIARLDEVSPDRFTYTLNAQAVHASFEAGDTLTDILADWERLLVIPIPEAISARLNEWWQAYGQVRIYENVTVIEFGDEYALAEMKAVTSLEKHLIAEISPRLVLIPQAAVEPLAAELEKAGYLPKQTDQV
jgi:hypothetical protein